VHTDLTICSRVSYLCFFHLDLWDQIGDQRGHVQMAVTSCIISSSVGHPRLDQVRLLEVTCYIPHQSTGVVSDVLWDMPTSLQEG
jgi:hypothetical protein